MWTVERFNKLMASVTTHVGIVLSRNDKVKNLIIKKAERAAYQFLIEENKDNRPVAVQKEKFQIMLNLMETAFNRIEEGLYSKSVIQAGP